MLPDEEHAPPSYRWIKFARADLAVATSLLPPDGLYDPLCFHAQQAVEKSLKAVLVEHEIVFPYTHNLKTLLNLLPPDVPQEAFLEEAALLTDYAISTRYPGQEEPISEESYREAIRLAEAVVRWAEEYLGLNDK